MKRMFQKNTLNWRTFSMVGAVLLALGTSNIPVASAADTDGAAAVSATAYVQILATTTVDYEATITRGTDGINTLPWGTQGYQTVGSSSSYLGKTVSVSQEKLADNGVTWALISLDGKQLGWIAKAALTEATYLAVISTTAVDYPATITRGTDAINAAAMGHERVQDTCPERRLYGQKRDRQPRESFGERRDLGLDFIGWHTIGLDRQRRFD